MTNPISSTASLGSSKASAHVALGVSAQGPSHTLKAPSSKLARAWNGVKKAWSWANQSPLRQVLLGVGAIAVGATISAATGGAAGLIGVPFILTGVYMVLKAVAKAAPVKGYLDKLYPKQSAVQTQTDIRGTGKVMRQSSSEILSEFAC